jgi:hypothetical protein
MALLLLPMDFKLDFPLLLVMTRTLLKWKVLASPLHFIAHSRGAVVNSEVIQRLGTYFPQVNSIDMTTLDPHDFNQPSLDIPIENLLTLPLKYLPIPGF